MSCGGGSIAEVVVTIAEVVVTMAGIASMVKVQGPQWISEPDNSSICVE